MTDIIDMPLSRRLKTSTGGTHDRLDTRIMAADPFASYGRFLMVQYAFHRDIAPVYDHAPLAALIPDLVERNRLARIGQDMADLGLAIPPVDGPSPFAEGVRDMSAALGWLYVAEGSNLGAAFLFKGAAALGLNGDHGARHLAGHADGRARHWRGFTDALDGLRLSDAETQQVEDGARAAFLRVHGLVDRHFA